MAKWDNLSDRLGIYRDTRNGWIAGVCAGIAARLRVKPLWVRGVFVLLAAVPHSIIGLLAYFALAFMLRPRAGLDEASSSAGVQLAYRDLAESVTSPFGSTSGRQVSGLKSRFAALDARLNNLEAAVTSNEISLRRKFKDLGG
ncbi:MAG: PspC domain-containing protein [Acidocella sp.]|nr:PspC domain-containing protein [Acidocella sp.]